MGVDPAGGFHLSCAYCREPTPLAENRICSKIPLLTSHAWYVFPITTLYPCNTWALLQDAAPASTLRRRCHALGHPQIGTTEIYLCESVGLVSPASCAFPLIYL